MWPLRPTAIATPGATASSIDVLTILSSLGASEVSSPELLRPTSGGTYWCCTGIGATTLACGGGAQAAIAATPMRIFEAEYFMRERRGDCGRSQDRRRTSGRTILSALGNCG